jgi:hypothetical protein
VGVSGDLVGSEDAAVPDDRRQAFDQLELC